MANIALNIKKQGTRSLLRILLALLMVSIVHTDEPTNSLTPCKLHDSNNGGCLKDLWQNILIKGIKDVPGVKWISIDPYKIKRIHVKVDTPIVNLDMDFKKIVITGLINSKVTDVSVKNEKTFYLGLKIPNILLKAEYGLAGRALVLNIDGKGPAEVEMKELEMEFAVDTKRVKKDSDDFFEVQSLKSNVKHIGFMHFQFDNLFGENKALTDSANDVFNQNWSQLIELMRPVIEEAIDASLLGQAKKYLDPLPGRIIFSDL
ncbi:circadian clock-controlled protein daywake [Stomoxys calcitrans]|uniref:Uncharacterized protein n=1 Tax=Stomoxys calcitrans TaxID=35570 RepID=A0A1I8NTH6_STOCA|nr:circadian clock-controlled protein daywake [Stomoxys calcitrans]